MATVIWRGDAELVAQESRATPDNVQVGDIFTLTCGETTISFTASATTAANVIAGLLALWNASTAPELAEITASDGTTYLKLLADTAGKPFTVTSSATNGGDADTQTLVITTPVAAAGPNCWDTAANWSSGAVPVGDDDIVIEDSDVDILYGLNQTGITADSLTIRASYTGSIGLPLINESGTTDYAEYRPTALIISPDVITIGGGDGDGSPFIAINTEAVTTALTVYSTGSATYESHGALQWVGTSASNTVTVLKGDVGIATHGGEVATVATLTVSYLDSQDSDASVVCGDGVTLTTIVQSGGTLDVSSNITTLTQQGGTCYVGGTATITTASIQAGILEHASSGTVTTLNVGSLGTANFNRSMAARTVTSTNAYAGCTIYDPHKKVTWTNGIDAVQCNPFTDCSINLGPHITVTPSAI